MKTKLFYLATLLFQLNCFAQYTAIPDFRFENALADRGYDSGPIDHKVLTANINTITSLNVNGCSIDDLTGIQDFVALKTLNCNNNQLTSLNVSGLAGLSDLYCGINQLMSLNVSGLTALTTLTCAGNQLTSLNVNGLTALTYFDCFANNLTSLNVSGLTALVGLSCFNNKLTDLNASELTALVGLSCGDNQLTNLNVSGLTALQDLWCDLNQLTSLNVSGLTALTTLHCNNNQLTSLSLCGLTALSTFSCLNNPSLLLIQADDIPTGNDNWSKDVTASYSFNCGLATSTYELTKDVAMFPNPTKAVLNLSDATNIDKIIIIDLTGKTVLHQTLTSNQVNVQNLAKGMYILQTYSGNEKFQSKFIKE